MKVLFSLFLTALVFSKHGFADTPTKYIKAHAQEFKNADVPKNLMAALESKRLILIGELHGTNEMPEFAFKFVEAMALKHDLAFGLEFPIDMQQQVDEFLKTGDEKILSELKFFKNPNLHSGRGSKAMVRLLKNLRSLPKLKVFCFDLPISQVEDNSNIKDRDTRMAENILKFISANSNLKVITFSGNIHSRLVSGTPWDPKYKTMGSEVLKLSQGRLNLKTVSNFEFLANEGSAWQCQFDSDKKIVCKDYSFGPSNTVYRTSVPFDRYFLHEPKITDGHLNSVFMNAISASDPWQTGT